MSPDFKRTVVEIVAKRAAFRCSNPDCRAATVGPNANPESATTIGEAAHISGARPGASRYDERLNDVARGSITNAIWLCRNCHRLIDSDSRTYSVEVLFAWREQHEEFCASKLGTSTDRIRLEHQRSSLSQFDEHPVLVRRIVIDRPDGWEWRLTAELLRHFNDPLFRAMKDLRGGLYVRQQQHVTSEEIPDWVRNRLAEMSTLLGPIPVLLDRLTKSWGPPGREGDIDEIHHICRLVRDNLREIVSFEERIQFANVPEDYEGVVEIMKNILASQAEKLADIPSELDNILAWAVENPEQQRRITKTIVLETPPGWERRIVREIQRASRGYSVGGAVGLLGVLLVVFICLTIVL